MRILVRQKSGLGNQLFQYAAGLYYAERYGAELYILRDLKRSSHSHGYPRPFQLSALSIAAEVRSISLPDRAMCSTRRRTLAVTGLARRLTATQTLLEPVGTYHIFQPDLALQASTRRVYIEGYWQAYAYADAVEGRLRAQFGFRQPPAGRDLQMLEQIKAAPAAVSLHIRRGDYMLEAEGNHALPMTYYRNAIHKVKQKVAQPTFFVFSDDIEFARQHLSDGGDFVFVDHNNALTAHEDLRLMAACRHHIIANSTFSWWGAWLNQERQKLVCAPATWLDPRTPTTDLLPPEWLRIDTVV